jgi:TonB family protein
VPTPPPVVKSAEPKPGVSGPAPASAEEPLAQQDAAFASVLHEVTPDVPKVFRERIRGQINVTVRVLVDPSGNVVGEFVESPGTSRYFARLASQAAEGWKFSPADNQGSRVWLVRFEFTRGGVTVRSNAAK